MWDILSFAAGLAGGTLGTIVAFEAMNRGKKADEAAPKTKLTTGWRIRELGNPIIVARDVLDLDVPAGTKVYASGVVDPGLLGTAQVQQVPPVRTEFALDLDRQRALIFTAGAQEGSLALLTVDPTMLARLETEYRTLAGHGGEYVERLQIKDLVGKNGVTVETKGFVQDVLPYKERFMIRLEDEGHIMGVLVEKNPEGLREERIQVKGKLQRDQTGYAVIVAEDIRRIR
ncbi:MAG: hypothetical protein ACPHK8_01505 [Thermoplasmatota archaeon]